MGINSPCEGKDGMNRIKRILSKLIETICNVRAEGHIHRMGEFMWYISGKTKILLRERFSKDCITFSERLENALRYEAEHSNADEKKNQKEDGS